MLPIENDIVSISRRVQITCLAPSIRFDVEFPNCRRANWGGSGAFATENKEKTIEVDYGHTGNVSVFIRNTKKIIYVATYLTAIPNCDIIVTDVLIPRVLIRS